MANAEGDRLAFRYSRFIHHFPRKMRMICHKDHVRAEPTRNTTQLRPRPQQASLGLQHIGANLTKRTTKRLTVSSLQSI